jgi:hypothetical protein
MSDALDVEYVTVGALLLAPAQIEQVRACLLPADFDRQPCAELYQLMLDMSARQLPVNPVSVLDELQRLGRLRGDGWPGSEISTMVRAVTTPSAAGHYGRLVLEDALFRELEDVGRRLAQLGRDRAGIEDALHRAVEPQQMLGGLRERWTRAELAGPPTAGMSDVQRAVQLHIAARLPLGRQRSRCPRRMPSAVGVQSGQPPGGLVELRPQVDRTVGRLPDGTRHRVRRSRAASARTDDQVGQVDPPAAGLLELAQHVAVAGRQRGLVVRVGAEQVPGSWLVTCSVGAEQLIAHR